MRKEIILALLVILLQFIIAIYYYPQMPDQIASHWNIEGIADGYFSKFWGLFLVPLISVGLFLLFAVIPRIDPLQHNIKDFIKYYWSFIVLFLGYMLYMELIIIVWNLGYTFNMFQALSTAIGILFFSIGFVIGKAKRNWFMGIRTPWTLSSDVVWNKTHRLGGKVFMISGLVSALGFFFEGYFALMLIMAPVMVGSIFLVVYSYFEYQKIPDKLKN
jgi:uncharacterized membrane protein